MRKELQEAYREIGRLKQELARQNPHAPEVPSAKLRTLRRQISFYCHPDRGGDEELMQRVNTLFDYLEHSCELPAKVA